MLTELQKSRVRFHLGYPNDQIVGPRLEVEQNLVLGNLNPLTELALVGDQGGVRYLFFSQDLCSEGSLLHKLEVAHDKLSPQVIEDSLFVQGAGSVTLRRDELQARKELYRFLQQELEKLLDIKLFTHSPQSLGYRY